MNDPGKHLAILGTGAALPARRVGPADFVIAGAPPALLAEWDVGEHRVAESESATDLEARAALQCIERAGWSPEEVDLMIGCTLLPEKVNPSNVALTQHKIGARRAAAIGVDMACIGPVPALMMADALFRTGQFSRIVVVASSQLAGAMDDTDPAVFAVCGDGAAAVALGPVDEQAGVVATHLAARGEYWNNVGIEPRGPRYPRSGGPCDVRPRFYIDHSRGGDLKEFFTWCMASVPDAVGELLRKVGLTIADVDWVCPHQNVKTVSEAWIDRIGVSRDRVIETRKEYGNVGPANVLLNLDRGATTGAFRHGDKILLFGQGSGMSVGALLLRWHGRGSTPPRTPPKSTPEPAR
ncbi:MAG TPA: 3-oxoacyl-[acyl-carrier-protein] synthase III C-terminal domain-containing protein [Polyangia bacterium]|jgi:3-oxoacyl-[acyl-carrier-protein] synthase-3|nr:3-oxoacyl-[acyl-carrier-protein] synthase III C-terminal domain-containing protein [Polyangia bacterium]